jgi:hypothetical protein
MLSQIDIFRLFRIFNIKLTAKPYKTVITFVEYRWCFHVSNNYILIIL